MKAWSNPWRMSLAKQFHGDLNATTAEMLTTSTDTRSAVSIAVERVAGTLHGRSGTFALVHHGTMTHARQHVRIMIVLDSGTVQLVRIASELAISYCR
jgi:hypothetical protein